MLPIKKRILNVIIGLFICSSISAKNHNIDYSATTESSRYSNESTAFGNITFVVDQTHGQTAYTDTDYNYETHAQYIERQSFQENETHQELPSYENSNTHSTPSYDHDLWDQHIRDQSVETRKEQANDHHSAHSQSTNQSESISAKQKAKFDKVLRECDQRTKRTKKSCNSIGLNTVDFKINNTKNLVDALKESAVKKQIEYHRDWKKNHETLRSNPKPARKTSKKEVVFLNKLLSGEVSQLLEKILRADPKTSHKSLVELKKIYPYERQYRFVVPLILDNKEETFIQECLGEDIVKIAEQNLLSRQDFINHFANKEELQIIQSFKEKCLLLQKQGDVKGLINESKKLSASIILNNKKYDFAANACIAIVETMLQNQITTVFENIKNAPSLESAHAEIINLEAQLLDQAHKANITRTDRIKRWTIRHYGFNVLDAAQECYKSRADYVVTVPAQKTLITNNLDAIVDNIEQKDLPSAHAELVHLDKQVDKILNDRKICDPVLQKEYIKRVLGKDIKTIARIAYEAREDHQQLVEAFIPIDVDLVSAHILETSNSTEQVADEMSDLAHDVLSNARHCHLMNLPKIETEIHHSIDAIRTAQDQPTFIFNFSMVNRTLSDLQQIAHAILTGKHPIIEKSSELLTESLGAFITGLDPFKQAESMQGLISDLGLFLKKEGAALWNDPITEINNGISTVFTITQLIRNVADFTSDLTVGKLYLSPEEYKQRIDTLCKTMEPLQSITARQCFHFAGQIAADFAFTKGIGTAYRFLKELDFLDKINKSASGIVLRLKNGFDTRLANNPIVVTAEGVKIKLSNAMHNLNNNGVEKMLSIAQKHYLKILIPKLLLN